MQTLKLKSREDRRLRQGHLWIYSNEIDTGSTPLKGVEPGAEVVITDAGDRALGRALVNPHALICGRLISRDADVGFGPAVLAERLTAALRLRERAYPDDPCYRLVFGEGDGLPGLVVDRYRDVFVVQASTLAMEQRRGMVAEALTELFAPRSIVFKHDAGSREAEDLPKYVETVGDDPGELVPLAENGVEFVAPLLSGQKTGWFFDHRDNRERLRRFAPGARVLDAFSYIGGWGLQALAFGASELVAVDGSAPALEVLEHNAARQGVTDRVAVRRGDCFAELTALADAGERFDLVIIDPPALIKRRKDLRAGRKGYQRLATLGMRLTADDGVLVFGSCSLHYDRAMLRDALRAAARHVDRQAQLVASGGLGLDHPVHPAITESDYLEAAFVRVRLPGRGGSL